MVGRNRSRLAKEKVQNRKRMLNGKEVKPVRFTSNGGKGIMTGSVDGELVCCLLYTSPSPRDPSISRMPSSA